MYLNWDTKVITDFSEKNINELYDAGYLFTRVGLGIMNKTRSLRINLSKFEPSSENRRIERKTEWLSSKVENIPFHDYSWHIAKLAKDFYDDRGADFSANKVKEILTEKQKNNFNKLFVFSNSRYKIQDSSRSPAVGYSISFENKKILHYSYPFYNPKTEESNLGMGMMLRAIMYAKDSGKDYIYLGALQRPSDTYKLQFSGQEWFNGESWQKDTEELRVLLKN